TEIFKVAILKLKGNAQSWYAGMAEKEENLNFNNFALQLLNRYNNTNEVHDKLEKFLSTSIPKDKSRYQGMLKEASFLLDNGCLNSLSMIKLVIARSPLELKPILFTLARNIGNDWTEFLKLTEESLWLAFPDKELGTISKNEYHFMNAAKDES
ncbi:hypothetical protein COBT_002804, partial [Conglomerata obtusa]